MAQTIYGIVLSIKDLLNLFVIPVLFGIATVIFLWGVIVYITSGGDEEKRKEGRNYIIYGLIGLFVMIALWGIINVMIGFFFPGGLPLQPPPLPILP